MSDRSQVYSSCLVRHSSTRAAGSSVTSAAARPTDATSSSVPYRSKATASTSMARKSRTAVERVAAGNPDTGAVRPRLGPLLAALLLVAAVAGATLALLRLADRRQADRAAEEARQATTVPSAGLDRQPNDGPAPTATAPPGTTPTTTPPADEGPAVVLRGDGIGAF